MGQPDTEDSGKKKKGGVKGVASQIQKEQEMNVPLIKVPSQDRT